MSKAGSSLLRTTMVRAADHARRQDPQLARIYYLQMLERGKDHLGALCVVAANLAERAWAVMRPGMPYVICDTDSRPINPEETKTIIAEPWTVPPQVRARRPSKKKGEGPSTSAHSTNEATPNDGQTRRPSPPGIVHASQQPPQPTNRLTADPP